MVAKATDLTREASAYHCAWLEVDEDGTRDVSATSRLIEVHVDALQLQVRVAVVTACGVNAMLIGDDLRVVSGVCLVGEQERKMFVFVRETTGW